MARQISLRDTLDDPRRRRHLTWAALAVLAWIALLLRWGIDLGGVLDTDTLNFGLAAVRFDILEHQPHPPGYLGYVVYLKAIRALVPALDPVEVALWGSRLCGMLTVPAAFWACRQLLAAEAPDAFGRPLAAAGIACVHPLLWYYGADGQAHAAEALAVLLLFGLCVRVRRAPALPALLLTVAAFGLAGALRPTIPLLSSPLLVWLFWRRPLLDWALALVVGLASVAVWAVPMIALSGGWDLYQRANAALVGDVFVANYSVFGARSHPVLVVANMLRAVLFALVALAPLLAWKWRGEGRGDWQFIWMVVVAGNVVFYGLVYVAEAGYLAALAGLACLVPATWPAALAPSLRARATLVMALLPTFFLAGPATAPIPNHPPAPLPTFGYAAIVQRVQGLELQALCAAAGGQAALVLTDNPVTTTTRRLPLTCPGTSLALYVSHLPFDPDRQIDAWLIFYDDGLQSVPTEVPLEPGPPATVRVRAPVERVVVAPDASEALASFVAAQASCPGAHHRDPELELELTYYPVACLPALATPSHVIRMGDAR